MSRKILAFALSVLLLGAFNVACVAPAPMAVQPAATELAVVQAATVAPTQGGASGNPTDADEVKITIVYDTTTTDPQLVPDWGFAAAVESGGHTLLFDTGDQAAVLLENLQVLGIELNTIEAVVLSHGHEDHTAGLQGLFDLGVKPTVYVPSKFFEPLKQKIRAQTELEEVDDALEILPGVFTTGPVGSTIIEQALVVETPEGAVMISGCAHPGVVEMVETAQEAVGSEIAVLIGGLHLLDIGEQEMQSIIAELRRLGVQRILPSHCTGASAIAAFRTEYGENCIQGGVGRTVSFGAKD